MSEFDAFDFEAAEDAAEDGRALIVDLDAYQGPMHLLLELARKQRVDLAQISILELAEQYIAFIRRADNMKIEVAADYLVMASWLAYLKSKLLLPKPPSDNIAPEAQELAAHLAFRLQRLEAMRRAADALMRLPRIGQSVFTRGAPEGLRSRTTPLWEAELFDILKAYGESRSKTALANHKLALPPVLSLQDARERLARSLAGLGKGADEWQSLESLLPTDVSPDVPKSSITASSLLASLELAKDGEVHIRQISNFAPIYLRKSEPENQDE
jgi:segregation and condensation protein A